MVLNRSSVLVALLALSASSGFSQDARATLLGVVIDPGGASVPRARVSAINMEMDVRSVTETNADGNYLIPYLVAGHYRVRVERDGFKTTERSPIELQSNGSLRLDVKLELGQVSEKVTVNAESPVLEVADANRGQVMDTKKLVDLPVPGYNPYGSLQFVAGMNFTGSTQNYDVASGGSTGNYSVNGGQPNLNEFQIDGISNASAGRLSLAATPALEAVQEVKVLTSPYSAEYGRTSGGVVSVSIKAGTNRLHGAVYENLMRTSLNANTFANDAAGLPTSPYGADHYGFEVDGPVVIPKLYDGKRRTFFLFSFDRMTYTTPLDAITSVPSAAEHSGDFSSTRTAAGALETIYDPTTTVPNPLYDSTHSVSLTNARYIRTPFPGNKIPSSRISAIGATLLGGFPAPNQAGVNNTDANNYYGSENPGSRYFQILNRFDHVISDRWRIFGRYSVDWYTSQRTSANGWAGCNGDPSGACLAATIAGAHVYDETSVIDLVGTLSPRTVLDVRFGTNLYDQSTFFPAFNQAQAGFSTSLLSQLPQPNRFPVISLQNYNGTNNPESNLKSPGMTYSGQWSILHQMTRHTLKAGGEYRILQYSYITVTGSAGSYAFNRDWTRGNIDVDDGTSGNGVATLLLGYPSSASAQINDSPYFSWHYAALYFQDDFQVSRRLTINAGLRWDVQTPPIERYNRQNRGFAFGAPSPVQAPGMTLTGGGLLFAGVGGQPRTAFNPDYYNFGPRLGLAYRVFESKPLVFRGGFGRFFLPTSGTGGATGFSQATQAQVSSPVGIPSITVANPFPNGLVQPPGGSLGPTAQLGGSISFVDTAQKTPYIWQYSAGFEYELRPGVLIEATYAGSQTEQLQVSNNINVLSIDQLSLGTAYLNQGVSNPFYGVLPSNTTLGSSTTTARRNLLLPYPQYTTMTESAISIGGTWYNSLQLKLEKRFKHGLTALVTYTNAKNMSSTAFKNPQDKQLSRELASFDVPQRTSMALLYELPFGPKRRWLHQGILSQITGDWQCGMTGIWQSGTPMALPNYNLEGNPQLPSSQQTLNHWFNTNPALWMIPQTDTLRTTPLYSPNIRRQTAPQFTMNLVREFRLYEGHRIQFKASAYNATNSPIFGFPGTNPQAANFGVVPITQINNPRAIELGARYAF